MPILMGLIAVNQIRMAKNYHLSPWIGGGFGMFSTNATPDSRILVCTGVDDSGNEVRLLPDFGKLDTEKWSKDYEIELKANPSLDKLQKIANALLNKNYLQKLNQEKQTVAEFIGWLVNESIYVPLRKDDLKLANEKMHSFETIKASIYERRYNANDNSVQFFELLNYQASK
jgi:hypothetical protein